MASPKHPSSRFRLLGMVVAFLGLVLLVWSLLLRGELSEGVQSASTPEWSLGMNLLIEGLAGPVFGMRTATTPYEAVSAMQSSIWVCTALGALLGLSGALLAFKRDRANPAA